MTMPNKISAARAPAPSPKMLARRSEPDLVDRIFDYLEPLLADRSPDDVATAKRAVAEEFRSERGHVRDRSRDYRATDVLALFNGRNASEVARRLNIGRATVYRLLKQPGQDLPSHANAAEPVSLLAVNETPIPVASGPSDDQAQTAPVEQQMTIAT